MIAVHAVPPQLSLSRLLLAVSLLTLLVCLLALLAGVMGCREGINRARDTYLSKSTKGHLKGVIKQEGFAAGG